MGCAQAKEMAVQTQQREQEMLGPPSKVQDASEYCQRLVYMVKPALEVELSVVYIKSLEAVQMIVQPYQGDNGSLWYVRVKAITSGKRKEKWVFVKIYEPPQLTNVSPVRLRGAVKVNEDDVLTTF